MAVGCVLKKKKKTAFNSSMSLRESRHPRETTMGISRPKTRIVYQDPDVPGQMPKANQVVSSEAIYFEKEIVS